MKISLITALIAIFILVVFIVLKLLALDRLYKEACTANLIFLTVDEYVTEAEKMDKFKSRVFLLEEKLSSLQIKGVKIKVLRRDSTEATEFLGLKISDSSELYKVIVNKNLTKIHSEPLFKNP